MRILVADTDVNHRLELVEVITQANHEAIEVGAGGDVLKEVKKKCPGLMFIDDKLPGTNGADFVKQIRLIGGHAVWNPIVLMSHEVTPELLEAGLEAGADDCLQKPLTPFQVQYLIRRAERHQNLKDEVFSVAHELVMANRALESLGSQDTMTGINDIQAFLQGLEKQWIDAKKSKKILSLIFVNLDCFSEFNDEYGAEQGDQVIKQTALTLRHHLPQKYKMLARTSGDTFAALLPDTGSKVALQIAGKLQASITNLKIPHKTSHCSDVVTVSVGVTSTEEQPFDRPLDMMEAADYALYQAKHRGRNQVCYVANEMS